MPFIRRATVNKYTAAGAIKHQDGVANLAGSSAIAMTISAPTLEDNGAQIRVVATTAQAHTVTFATTGFNAAGTDGDVATFGGAKGDAMVIEALEGVWYTISLRNVTLG